MATVPPSIDPTVLACVPHRAPILRVHRVVQADPLEAVLVGCEPIGPGALPWELGAIEGLAQSAAVLLAQALPKPTESPEPHAPPEAPRGMLVAIKRFTIDAHPPCGVELLYRVRLVRRLGPTALVTGYVQWDGRRMAGGDLTLWAAPGA